MSDLVFQRSGGAAARLNQWVILVAGCLLSAAASWVASQSTGAEALAVAVAQNTVEIVHLHADLLRLSEELSKHETDSAIALGAQMSGGVAEEKFRETAARLDAQEKHLEFLDSRLDKRR